MNNQPKNNSKKGVKSPIKVKSEELRVKSELQLNTQNSIFNNDFFLLAVISSITFICFHYTLHNQFLNWDDGIYVVDDPFIKSLTRAHVFDIFFQNITQNYYHPLTMFSFAMNYYFSGMNPEGYYFTAIIIHILNVIMVFYFTRALMESMTGVGYKLIKPVSWLAAMLALWFGIHPMHVESVSWISERKDVMYGVFYFLALFMYLKYLKGEKMRWMLYVNILFALICLWGLIGLWGFSIDFKIKSLAVSIPIYLVLAFLILMYGGAAFLELKAKNEQSRLTSFLPFFYVFEIFLLSLWSKPMAVSFPLSLLTIDILLKRDMEVIPQKKIYKIISSLLSYTGKRVSIFLTVMFKLMVEKWLYWLTAVLSGIQSVIMQVASGSLVLTHGYTLYQKFLIACYSFMMYTAKAFAPFNLCSYYPYPGITSEHYIEYPIFYWAPLIDLAIWGIPLFLAYRSMKNKDSFRVTLFCLLFYFSNLVFILQFVSSGTTIISDRYSYVSYFGLFFFFIYLANWHWQKSKSNHLLILISIGFVTCFMADLCEERTRAWHDPKSLWSDVIAKANRRSELPYLNLGDWYVAKKQYDSAYPYYKSLVDLKTKQPGIFRSLGKIYGLRQQYDSSLACINRSIALDSTNYEAYDDRAVTYSIMGKLNLAIKDYDKAFSIDSTDEGLWTQRGFALQQLGMYARSLQDYNRLVNKHPEDAEYLFERGNCELNLGAYQSAIADYLKTISINPKNGNCLYDLSMAYNKISDYKDALDYAQKAIAAGVKVPDEYMNKLGK